jgi:hypothetical protein
MLQTPIVTAAVQTESDSKPPRQWDVREILSDVAELAGISAISGGFWLITPAAGLISGGLGLVLVGFSLAPRTLRDPKPKLAPLGVGR